MELLWLLLPVAAASGWYAGRRALRRSKRRDAPDIPPEYFRGLNYLLNEQQDKALEVFLRLVQDDSETIETHLALGGLFRRRGEVERAIRIHQNLLARPSLEPSQRSVALMELAKDYMHAGLLDRAESLLIEIVKQRHYQAEALEHLLSIYQREHEWEKAIRTARSKGATGDPNIRHMIAHCYCEIAETERRNGARHRAVDALKNALNTDPRSVRANILLGDIAFNDEQYTQAFRYYAGVFQLDEEFVPEVVERIVQCVEKGAPAHEFENQLRQFSTGVHRTALLPGLTRYYSATRSVEEARDYAREQLLKAPTLYGLKEWVELELSTWSAPNHSMQQIAYVLGELSRQWPAYRCRHCGYRSTILNWQCPTCKSWSTVKPAISGAI